MASQRRSAATPQGRPKPRGPGLPEPPHIRHSPPPSWLCGTPSSPSSRRSSRPPSLSSPAFPSSPWLKGRARPRGKHRARRTALAAQGAPRGGQRSPLQPGTSRPRPASCPSGRGRGVPLQVGRTRRGRYRPAAFPPVGLRECGGQGLPRPGPVIPTGPGRGFNAAPHTACHPPLESRPLFDACCYLLLPWGERWTLKMAPHLTQNGPSWGSKGLRGCLKVWARPGRGAAQK